MRVALKTRRNSVRWQSNVRVCLKYLDQEATRDETRRHQLVKSARMSFSLFSAEPRQTAVGLNKTARTRQRWAGGGAGCWIALCLFSGVSLLVQTNNTYSSSLTVMECRFSSSESRL